MSEMGQDALNDPGSPAPGSAEGSRLFVDLGAGAGAIPVRAAEGKPPVLKSSFAGVTGFMVVLAAGGIFGMRKLGMSVGTASAADTPIAAIESTPPTKIESGRFENLMAELEAGDRPVQIDSGRLGRSPFELAVEQAKVVEQPKETDEERLARLAEEARRKAEADRKNLIESTLTGLKLFGVVGGRTPAAKINTQIVREGDMIADLFTVKQIKARSVVLEVDGVEYEIEMNGSGKP